MELKGHKKKVMSVALSPDNRRAVTVSQDGTLRVWNIDVRYGMSEDPKTLLTVRVSSVKRLGASFPPPRCQIVSLGLRRFDPELDSHSAPFRPPSVRNPCPLIWLFSFPAAPSPVLCSPPHCSPVHLLFPADGPGDHIRAPH